MKKWIIGLALANVVALGACAPAPQPAAEPVAAPVVDTAADEAAIRDISTAIAAALNAGDVEGYVANYTDDALMMSPNRPPLEGPEAISAWFSGMLETFSVSYVTSTEEIVVTGDLAYEMFSTHLEADLINGTESLVENGTTIRIYQRQSDGGWKISRSIWALDGTGQASETAE